MNEEIECKTHPDAPHGFVRNASHTEDRYVCECEYWEEPKVNKQIQELMSKTLDEKFASTWSTMDMQDLAKFSERFAELIVQEAIGLCRVEVDALTGPFLPEYEKGIVEGYRRANENLRFYFGVEE